MATARPIEEREVYDAILKGAKQSIRVSMPGLLSLLIRKPLHALLKCRYISLSQSQRKANPLIGWRRTMFSTRLF